MTIHPAKKVQAGRCVNLARPASASGSAVFADAADAFEAAGDVKRCHLHHSSKLVRPAFSRRIRSPIYFAAVVAANCFSTCVLKAATDCFCGPVNDGSASSLSRQFKAAGKAPDWMDLQALSASAFNSGGAAAKSLKNWTALNACCDCCVVASACLPQPANSNRNTDAATVRRNFCIKCLACEDQKGVPAMPLMRGE